jgi:hypothetical protein
MSEGLAIYKEVSTGVYALYGNNIVNAIATSHDRGVGEIKEGQLFLRNDDPVKYYTYITMKPENASSIDYISFIETGWGVKLKKSTTQPTEAEWAYLDYANTISFDDIANITTPDITTYQSFWYRVECPTGAQQDMIQDILFALYYTSATIP